MLYYQVILIDQIILSNWIQSFSDRVGGEILIHRKEHLEQSIIEYALIIVFVAVVIVIFLAFVGPSIGNVYSGIITTL